MRIEKSAISGAFSYLSMTTFIRDSMDGGYPSDHYPVMASVKV
jgi:hypothetical protein